MHVFSSVLVYNGRGTLDEGETAEARFIKIQAAYELLIDEEKRSQYDKDNRVNPMKVIVISILLAISMLAEYIDGEQYILKFFRLHHVMVTGNLYK